MVTQHSQEPFTTREKEKAAHKLTLLVADFEAPFTAQNCNHLVSSYI